MLRLEIDGEKVRVSFFHITPNKHNLHRLNPPVHGYTRCCVKILRGDKWQVENVGETYCSASDSFDRGIGRKIALTRALADFDRGFRSTVWSAYFKKTKGE